MPTRTVPAVRREDGQFETLEPVDVPAGTIVQVTFETPKVQKPGRRAELPVWPGTVIGDLTRDEIYEHL